jgi:hypothetical protein
MSLLFNAVGLGSSAARADWMLADNAVCMLAACSIAALELLMAPGALGTRGQVAACAVPGADRNGVR